MEEKRISISQHPTLVPKQGCVCKGEGGRSRLGVNTIDGSKHPKFLGKQYTWMPDCILPVLPVLHSDSVAVRKRAQSVVDQLGPMESEKAEKCHHHSQHAATQKQQPLGAQKK